MNGEPAGLGGLSIRDVIDQRAEQSPDQIFLIDPSKNEIVSYGRLREAAQAITHQIAVQGLQPGDSVAYALTNGAHAAQVVLGILYGGYLATAVNLVAGKQTIGYVLEHSGAKLVFHQADTKPLLDEALIDGAHIDTSMGDGAHPKFALVDESIFYRKEDLAPNHVPQASDEGLLMYTSGTTGVPKGVVLTQGNLIAGGANAMVAHDLKSTDRGLCVLPLYHINGLCVSIMGALVSGGSVIIPKRFSVSQFWEQLKEHAGTWFSIVPTQVSYLLHEAETKVGSRVEGLRFGRSASAPLAPDVQRAFEEKFSVPIIETMGLTETAAQILSNPLPPAERKIGSPGLAVGNEIVIGDVNQKEVARGEEGEVLVRGPNVMRCYLKNEEATRESITPDGWLRTGDLGRMDADGYVFITGRLKELIIKGGENIAPREVDEALYSHADVVEAAAFA